MKCARSLSVGLIALGALLSSGSSWGENEVVYFDKPPTQEELAKALQRASVHKPSTSIGGRGIEWNADSPAEPAGNTPSNAAQPQPDPAQPQSGPAVAIPVNFDRGSSEIIGTSLPYIDAIATALVRDPGLKLLVEGHTDSTGDPQRNLMLSWERAFTVFRVLVSKYGIDASRLRPEGKGALEPMQGVAPSNGINRRVQFRPMG